MEAINIEQAIKLAEMRAKDIKEYENLMANLFVVYYDFVIFESNFEEVVARFDKDKEEKKK